MEYTSFKPTKRIEGLVWKIETVVAELSRSRLVGAIKENLLLLTERCIAERSAQCKDPGSTSLNGKRCPLGHHTSAGHIYTECASCGIFTTGG